MTDEKVYRPEEIEDQPLPMQGDVDFVQQQSSGRNETFSPNTIKDHPLPKPVIANETIGSSLNTKSRKILAEYGFTESGALAIGKFQPGISGDIRITPDGITARDAAGVNTFVLDGDTGDAFFAGTILTGALVAGIVQVGNGTWIIDGNPEAPRILLYNNGVPEILIGEDV